MSNENNATQKPAAACAGGAEAAEDLEGMRLR